MILYICRETRMLYIAYIDKRFILLCTISFHELCIASKVFLNIIVTPQSQPTSYVFKLYVYIICNTHNTPTYILLVSNCETYEKLLVSGYEIHYCNFDCTHRTSLPSINATITKCPRSSDVA